MVLGLNKANVMPVLTGRWRVSRDGVFCGTLRIAVFDFDTDPSDEFKDAVCKQMESALNGEDFSDETDSPYWK